MKFILDIRTESEANKREHWAVKAKRTRQQRTLAEKVCSANPDSYSLPVLVKLTRVGKRRLDDDNLSRSFKAIRDGIADSLDIDDGSEHIRFFCNQEIGKEYHVKVGII